ncbi:MAG: hflK [Clostridia bacterium]|jgi:membrane protease subunit HflK|nr:hflK [Clostridia bacterium]
MVYRWGKWYNYYRLSQKGEKILDNEEVIIDMDKMDKTEKLNQFGNGLKKVIFTVIVILAAAVLVLTSVYRLETGTVAVITRFGNVLPVNERAGIHFKVPFIDHVQKVNVQEVKEMQYGFRVQKEGNTTQPAEYVTNNEEELVIVNGTSNNASIVLLNLIVRYQVEDPMNYLFEVDELESTMRLALEDVVRNTMQTFTMNQAVEQKEEIDKAILPVLQKKLDKYHAGIKITQVTTQNVEYLAQVDEARQKVEEANQYKRGREEEAEKYVNTVIPTANAEATKLHEDAKGYHAQVIAGARADVAEFEALYSEYVQNPKVVKEKYYIEAMQTVLKNNQFIIDQTNSGNLLKFFDINDKAAKLNEEGGTSNETQN